MSAKLEYLPNIDEDNLNFCKDWIKNFSNNSKALLITGSSGCGKTNFASDLLKKNNYYVHYFNALDFASKKKVESLIMKIINSKNISIMTKNVKKSSIIIDEIEGINCYGKRYMVNILNIFKNKNKKNIPIICIGTGAYFKNIVDLNRLCIHIKINIPTNNNLHDFLDYKLKQDNLNMSEKIYDNVINLCQNDYRRLNNIYKFILYDKIKKNKISNTYINNIKKFIYEKNNKESELFKFTKILLTKNVDNELSYNYYNQVKVLLPLMIHQNYKNFIFYKKINKKQKNNLIIKISNIISKSDILSNYIYNNHYWHLQKTFCYFSCFLPSYYLNLHKFKNKNKYPEIIFTSILSRNSIQRVRNNQYYKIIYLIKNIYNIYNKDIIKNLCSNILNKLISTNENNIKKGLSIMNEYNIQIKNIVPMIRISSNKKYKQKYNKKLLFKIKKIHKKIYLK